MTSSTKVFTPAALNDQLYNAFLGLLKLQYFSGVKGDSVDQSIRAKLLREVRVLEPLSHDEWSKQGQFAEAREAVARGTYVFNSVFDRAYLVDKPNNTQQAPDLLVVYRSRGMYIEVKSGKSGKISWNSGGGNRIPMKGIHIFNGQPPRDSSLQCTTFLLGEDIINPAEQRVLELADAANRDVAKQFNKLLEDQQSTWSLYPRPMFNCADNVLTNKLRDHREQKVLQWIRDFSWDASR